MIGKFNKAKIAQKFSVACDKYDDHALIQRKSAKILAAMALSDKRESQYILDLGCGTGAIYQEIIKIDPSFSGKFVASDISSKMLAKSKSPYLVVCDFDHLPFKSEIFDLVISSFSLQWSSNLNRAVKNISKLLKNNGVFAFGIPINGSLIEIRSLAKMANCPLSFNELPKISEVKNFLKIAGFTNIKITSETMVENFPDPISAINNLKLIGASHSSSTSIIKKSELKRLQKIFKESRNESFKNSWEILFITAQK